MIWVITSLDASKRELLIKFNKTIQQIHTYVRLEVHTYVRHLTIISKLQNAYAQLNISRNVVWILYSVQFISNNEFKFHFIDQHNFKLESNSMQLNSITFISIWEIDR